MDLNQYKPSELELWINDRYQAEGIYSPQDMEIERIAALFGMEVMRYGGPSFADWKEHGYSVIFLNQYLEPEEAREVFFHELCHPLRHVGVQEDMPTTFSELQEIQAGLFQLYAAMPFYLLVNYEEYLYSSSAVSFLSEEFRLPAGLVERRLKQIASRFHRIREEEAIFNSVPRQPESAIVVHSPETLKLLNKLLWISAQKGRGVSMDPPVK